MTLIDFSRLIAHKKEGYYPSFLHMDYELPPTETTTMLVTVPMDKVYVVKTIVHDVVGGIIKHKCWKDGKLVIPETLITGDLMTCDYTEPFIVINKIHGIITNTDENNTHRFSLTYYMLICDVEKFEKEAW